MKDDQRAGRKRKRKRMRMRMRMRRWISIRALKHEWELVVPTQTMVALTCQFASLVG